MSTEIRKSQALAVPWVPITRALREHVMGIDRPSDGHSLPVPRASSAHFMGWFLGCSFLYLVCSFLYLVDYIVPYSYCKLTIIFSIPNSTCQSSILFLVSIYILHILFLLSIDIQNSFYKIKRQKKVGMGIKEKGEKKEKRNNSYSRRRVYNQEYKGEI